MITGRCREKTCLQGLRPVKTQSHLLSYSDYQEYCAFAIGKFRYKAFRKVKDNDADHCVGAQADMRISCSHAKNQV